MTQIFVVSCVDFEVAHLSVLMVWRLPHPEIPTLTRVKDTLPIGKQSNEVHRIPCSCGQVYIGETKPRLETRLREHQPVTEG